IVSESTNITVNGMKAISMLSDVQPKDESGQATGTPLKVLTYLIEYNKMIYKFHGLSAKDDFQNYFSSFLNTMKNFNVLTDVSKINRKPTLIKIVQNGKNQSLKDAFNEHKMPAARHNELSILNNLVLTDQVSKGTLIKIFSGQY